MVTMREVIAYHRDKEAGKRPVSTPSWHGDVADLLASASVRSDPRLEPDQCERCFRRNAMRGDRCRFCHFPD